MNNDRRVLIVDDSQSDATITRICAERHGFLPEVLCSHRDSHGVVGKLVHRLEDSDVPGIIVIDGLDGECYAAVSKIQKAKPGARYLIYTSSKEEIVDGMPDGMNVKVFQRGDARIYDYICQP